MCIHTHTMNARTYIHACIHHAFIYTYIHIKHLYKYTYMSCIPHTYTKQTKEGRKEGRKGRKEGRKEQTSTKTKIQIYIHTCIHTQMHTWTKAHLHTCNHAYIQYCLTFIPASTSLHYVTLHYSYCTLLYLCPNLHWATAHDSAIVSRCAAEQCTMLFYCYTIRS